MTKFQAKFHVIKLVPYVMDCRSKPNRHDCGVLGLLTTVQFCVKLVLWLCLYREVEVSLGFSLKDGVVRYFV